uniref:Cytochrome b5 n=1 Tax=Lygus hesperus TaxID=30085 RepID=A0A0A9XUQ6_LYGHE
MHKHPGGLDPIKDMGGMDITSSFESIGHSSFALATSKSYIIGRVDPASAPKRAATANTDTELPKWSEMDRNALRKYKAGGEIIPLWLIFTIVLIMFCVLYRLIF